MRPLYNIKKIDKSRPLSLSKGRLNKRRFDKLNERIIVNNIMDLKLGIKGEESEVVRHDNTAAAYGSGLVEVYATPAMIALMEKTCYRSVMPYLSEGEGTVGTHINVAHKKASPLGTVITCRSEIVEIDRRRVVFKVEATDDKGDVIGDGTHERFVINVEKFMSK